MDTPTRIGESITCDACQQETKTRIGLDSWGNDAINPTCHLCGFDNYGLIPLRGEDDLREV
jgi:hypothetical protein